VIKQTDWKEHVGLKDNFELLKMLETVYGVMCNMELMVIPTMWLIGIFRMHNKVHTLIFLLTMTLVIMNFEWVIPVAFFGSAVRILHIYYAHETYYPGKPDVNANIDFIRDLSPILVKIKFYLDTFLVEVVYWKEPQKSIKFITLLTVLSVVSFVALHIVPFRVFVAGLMWFLVAIQIQFVWDLVGIILVALWNFDLRPATNYAYAKVTDLYQVGSKVWVWIAWVFAIVSCKRVRDFYRDMTNEGLATLVYL
jgi:hypothetical protein